MVVYYCLIGEYIRKWGEICAKHNFTHVIQTEKEVSVVTEGPYKIFGIRIFRMAFGGTRTQLVLGNVVSVVVFVFVSWRFLQTHTGGEYFLERIFREGRPVNARQKTQRGYETLEMGWCSLGSCNS